MNGWKVRRRELATATMLALLSAAGTGAAELDPASSCLIQSTGKKTRLRATPMPSSTAIRQSLVSISCWSSGMQAI